MVVPSFGLEPQKTMQKFILLDPVPPPKKRRRRRRRRDFIDIKGTYNFKAAYVFIMVLIGLFKYLKVIKGKSSKDVQTYNCPCECYPYLSARFLKNWSMLRDIMSMAKTRILSGSPSIWPVSSSSFFCFLLMLMMWYRAQPIMHKKKMKMWMKE